MIFYGKSLVKKTRKIVLFTDLGVLYGVVVVLPEPFRGFGQGGWRNPTDTAIFSQLLL